MMSRTEPWWRADLARGPEEMIRIGPAGLDSGQAEAAPQTVSTIMRVTVYGSQLELGLRSSM